MRIYACRLPHRRQRWYFLALNFGFLFAFTINEILANAHPPFFGQRGIRERHAQELQQLAGLVVRLRRRHHGDIHSLGLFDLVRLNEVTALKNALGWVVTISLLSFSLLFFRANSLGDSVLLIKNSLDFSGTKEAVRFMLRNGELLFGLVMIIVLMAAEFLHAKYDLTRIISGRPLIVRWGIYIGFIFFILVFGVLQKQKFIYFQF